MIEKLQFFIKQFAERISSKIKKAINKNFSELKCFKVSERILDYILDLRAKNPPARQLTDFANVGLKSKAS